MAFIGAIIAAAAWVFSSGSIWAAAIRFVGGTILSQLLAGEQKTEGPRLSDLKVQVSQYGKAIPRIYGEAVRISGNVIDKSDLMETAKKKKKKMLGLTVASQTTYTYRVNLVVLLCEGILPRTALRRIFANGKCIFDRDADGALPAAEVSSSPVVNGAGVYWTNEFYTHSLMSNVRFYQGNGIQEIDPTVQALHPLQDVPAYRHSAYVVIDQLLLTDFGNSVPNLEFELESNYTSLRGAVEDLATFADVDVRAIRINQPLRGYVVANAGSVWSAIEPLAGAFAFDFITDGPDFRAQPRGRHMRTILDDDNFAARPAGDGARDVLRLKREDPNSYPDEVTVTYFDSTRDYQPNTQRAFRNEGYSNNKVDVELAVVFEGGDHPRRIAQRTLSESLSGQNLIDLEVSSRYNWLEAGDLVGVPVADQVEPFRLLDRTESPNGVVVFKAMYEDCLAYDSNVPGDSGTFPDNPLLLPGDSILQLIDAPVVEDADDNAGFYFGVATESDGWYGTDVERAPGTAAPLTYDLLVDPIRQASIADVSDVLADGPTDVWDYVNTLTVVMIGGDDPEAATEDQVIQTNANFAWVGGVDGHDGEYINFTTVAAGSPEGTFTLGGLLRGRRGTEHNVAGHGAGERFVIMNTSEVNHFEFPPSDWNVTNTYRSWSHGQPEADAEVQEFANTGEGKRPYAPVHLNGTRNGSNDDVLLSWVRRTRLETPAIGGGPVPIGEATEAYEVDVYSELNPSIVVRTLTTTTASVNYTTAMATADTNTPGGPVKIAVYQLSDVRGRGHAAEGVV